MAETIQYKCPCCGGAIEFNSTIQKMKCPFCDTEFDVDALRSYTETAKQDKKPSMEWKDETSSDWRAGEQDGMRIYSCKSCGGEIVGDANIGATSCPYCGNPVVMTGQFSGGLRPDYVLPFKLDKKLAKEALKKHISRFKLVPKVYQDENHLDEIQGVYVPFWLYDAKADASIRYHATRIRHWQDARRRYTETSHFMVMRQGSLRFQKVPVDGSTKMADELMESIEPYDLREAVDFQTAYLAGYLADKYDLSAEQCRGRADDRVKVSTERAFAGTVQGYATVMPEHTDISLSNGSIKYALLPVWLLSTSWGGKHFLFAMNGQTGKFVGDLPLDRKAYWRGFAIRTAIWSAVGSLALALLYLL